DLYIGGFEHAAGHLIYFRFITLFLHDHGFLTVQEPAVKLFNHGMVLDEHGDVMSKSKGNAVSPRDLIDANGIDVARIAVLFFAPPGREIRWHKKGLKGAQRFLTRFGALAGEHLANYHGMDANKLQQKDYQFYRIIEETIRSVTIDMDRLDFNTAIASLMELLNHMQGFEQKDAPIFQYAIRKFNLMLAPFAPHLAEEIFSRYASSDSVFHETWPSYDENAIKKEEATIVIQINGKVRSRFMVHIGTDVEVIKKRALEDEKIKKYLSNKEIKKFIYINDKILNIVL
ncbi:MAG: leucine--tRNA ligase, partial [Candidatus Cloacimonadota bacterium]